MDNIPANEQQRLETLQRYQIIDTPPEQSFDNIGKVATQFFDLPVAMISFIDTENVFIKTKVGIDVVSKIPRSNSLCSITLLNNELTVFENIPEIDHCFPVDGPSAADYGFKFYAGTPIVSANGLSIGVICLMGMEVRGFSEKEEELLKKLAVIVMDEIELLLQGKLEAEKDLLTAIHHAQLNFNNQSLIAHAPVAIAILTGRELTIEIANIKILEVWGKTDSVIGKSMKDALPELEGQPYLQIFDDVFTSGKPFYGNELSATLVRNGVIEDVYFNFVYQPLKDVSGSTVSIMIVATEVTEHIKARKLLEESEKQLENMVMSSTAGMVIYKGRNLIIETVNQRILDIWEKNAEEVVGMSLFDLFPGHVTEAYPGPMLNVFDSREPVSFTEIEVVFPALPEDRSFFLNVSYFPLIDEAGEVNHIMVSLQDVTEIVKARKLSEQTAIEQKAANEALIKAIEEFAKANKELLANNKDLKQTHEILKNTLSELPSSSR
ncbi:PAS domain-containing protein [Pedobacter sp. L105]|uniref:PAS domain-containing protein n=1 Tax=Pedobacter sp. L105 TaxID=1641871 RepID=UPI00131EAC81|nr:PAS domain-containing protein [Pedobacter sp. L105]